MLDPKPRVGFVGLGRMGLPMSRKLLEAGYPLTVYNRTAAKADALAAAGARVATRVGDLASEADIVCTCLDTTAASAKIFLGPDGVLTHGRPGTIAIDHGTIGPDLARRIAGSLGERGIEFLDAPVSGGPEGASQGTLTIMVGGAADTFDRALPMMRAYGRTIARMGAAGAGSLTKLVNQLLTFVHGAVAAESLALAERVGLDLAALGEVLAASFGQSRMLERTLGRVRTGDFEAGAALRLYSKDLGLVEQAATEAGARVPMLAAAEAVLNQALERGLSERDVAALVLMFRDPRPR